MLLTTLFCHVRTNGDVNLRPDVQICCADNNQLETTVILHNCALIAHCHRTCASYYHGNVIYILR